MAANPSAGRATLMSDHQTISFGASTKGLSVRTEVCEGVFILQCRGRLVFGDEGAILRERVLGMLEGSPKMVVNLRGVDHVDSGGIGVLIGLLVSARNRGGDLKLVAPSRHVTDVLRRTNLHLIFELYASDDEAVAAFHQQVHSAECPRRDC